MSAFTRDFGALCGAPQGRDTHQQAPDQQVQHFVPHSIRGTPQKAGDTHQQWLQRRTN